MLVSIWSPFSCNENLGPGKFLTAKIVCWSTKYLGRITLPWSENNFSPGNLWVEKYFWSQIDFIAKLKYFGDQFYVLSYSSNLTPFIFGDHLISISIMLENHFLYFCIPEPHCLDWTRERGKGWGLIQKHFWALPK